VQRPRPRPTILALKPRHNIIGEQTVHVRFEYIVICAIVCVIISRSTRSEVVAMHVLRKSCQFCTGHGKSWKMMIMSCNFYNCTEQFCKSDTIQIMNCNMILLTHFVNRQVVLSF